MVLEVDLNSPPLESCNEVGTSSLARGSLCPQSDERGPSGVHGSLQGCPSQLITPIDVDSFDDDDVILSSPRAFAEAKNNSRRNRVRRNLIDVDLEVISRHIHKRQRVLETPPCNNYSACINPESNSHSVESSSKNMQPPPPEPTFSCPVCMGPLVEEMSTKCGHIFCKACIKQAIAAQGKCPTCRRKVTMRGTIRIYLPATK